MRSSGLTLGTRGRLLLLATVLSLVSAACASSATGQFDVPPPETAAPGESPVESTTLSATTQPVFAEPSLGVSGLVEYEFIGEVIEAPESVPYLCGLVLTSYPPQCGGVPVVGLDWDAVPWAEEASGTTWASLRLIGSFDGEEFELTRRPLEMPEIVDEGPPFDTTTPCEEPPGGWQVVNPATADNDAAAVAYAQAQPDFMGNWVDRLPASAAVYSVKNFTFVDNVAEHEARLREIFGGALCVSQAPYSLGELEQIRAELKQLLPSAEAKAAGVFVWPSGEFGDTIDVIRAKVMVYVFAADNPRAQGWLDWKFGEGIVELYTQLRRVAP